MKTTRNLLNTRRFSVALALIATGLLSASSAQAQTTYAWDPGQTGNQFVGGSGTWDDGTTVAWLPNGNPPDVVWTNNNPNVNVAFEGTPGLVTVNGNVNFDYLQTVNNNAGTWTFGTAPNVGTITKDTEATYSGGFVFGQNSNANVIFNSAWNIDTGANTDRAVFQDNSATASLTFNGDITLVGTNAGAPYRGMEFDSQGGLVTINGAISSGSTGVEAEMVIGEGGGVANATYVLNGSLNGEVSGGKQLEIFAGQLVLGSSNLGSSPLVFIGNGYSSTRSMLTSGAQTITNEIADQGNGSDEIGGSTADVSSFNGPVASGGSTYTFTAASGGRVNINGTVFGSIAGGLVKTGAGTVVLGNSNSYDVYDPRTNAQGSVAADLQAGRTLITNSTGSAFGNNISAVVKVEAGATLGGTGISTQTVVAVNPGTSIIAPGDAGQANLGIAPSMGLLTLEGGLDTSNGGATLDFKINGANNDQISFGDAGFDPTGVLTVNFANIGDLNTGVLTGPNNIYTFIPAGSGDLTDGDLTQLNLVAPYGYTAQEVNFSDFGGFQVEFTEVIPEPSTYALMLGGLGFLAFCLRRKSRASV